MKNFFEILNENNIEIPEDKKDGLKKAVSENYKTISEFNNQKEKLDNANNLITELNGKITTLEKNDTDIEELQNKIRLYEEAETERTNKEKEARETEALKTRFNPLKGENAFINEGTEMWIFGEFKKALENEENKGKSDKEIYDSIVKDKDIYKNPNQRINIPGVGNIGGNKGDKAYMDSFYRDNPFYKNKE